jgi:hypothetical protein
MDCEVAQLCPQHRHETWIVQEKLIPAVDKKARSRCIFAQQPSRSKQHAHKQIHLNSSPTSTYHLGILQPFSPHLALHLEIVVLLEAPVPQKRENQLEVRENHAPSGKPIGLCDRNCSSQSGLSTNLAGWWLTYPSEKYEFVNGKDDIPYMK